MKLLLNYQPNVEFFPQNCRTHQFLLIFTRLFGISFASIVFVYLCTQSKQIFFYSQNSSDHTVNIAFRIQFYRLIILVLFHFHISLSHIYSEFSLLEPPYLLEPQTRIKLFLTVPKNLLIFYIYRIYCEISRNYTKKYQFILRFTLLILLSSHVIL